MSNPPNTMSNPRIPFKTLLVFMHKENPLLGIDTNDHRQELWLMMNCS